MVRPDRVLAFFESAIERLDDGEIDRAQEILKKMEKLAPDAAETHLLGGEIASLEGRAPDAVACFERAMEADPEWPIPALAAARELLEGLHDPDAALALVEPLLEHEDRSIRAEALFEAARAEIALDEDATAREYLEAIAEGSMDQAQNDFYVDAGDLALMIEDAPLAEHFYRAVLLQDAENADALYGLGFVLRETDRKEEMATVWLKVRALDLARPRPELTLAEAEIDRIAHETLRELPKEVRDRLADVPVLLEDSPSEARIREGVDPRLLGLFEGTPLGDKSHLAGSQQSPDAAYLFVRNLEAACETEEELREELRITILHETAHFFGLDDDDLDELGLS